MPLSARSLRRSLAPLLLCLAPARGERRVRRDDPARRMGHPAGLCRRRLRALRRLRLRRGGGPAVPDGDGPPLGARYGLRGARRRACRLRHPDPRQLRPGEDPRPDRGAAAGAARHPARLRGGLQQAAGRGDGRQGPASAARVHRVRLRADPMDRVRHRDDLRRHHGGPVLALLERAQQRQGARRADRPARRGAGPADLRPDLLDRGPAGADDRARGRAVPRRGAGACAGRCRPLRRALDAADPRQRGRPAPRQQPLDPRAEEDHRRQHRPRRTGRSSATSIRPMSSASACTAPASTSPAIPPSPCRTSSSAPTAPSPGAPPPDRSTSTTMCSSSSTRRTRTSTATTAAGPTCGSARRRSRSRAATT